MKTAGLLAALLLLAPAPILAQTAAQPEPDLDRFHYFVQVAILSPSPYALSLASAVLDELGNFPEEWNDDKPFVKRYFARQGMSLTSDAVGHSVAALIHHRVRYDMCTCAGWSRVRHAVGRAFVSRKEGGGSAPNYSLWIAKYSAAGLANTWYPASYTASDIIREGAFGIVGSGGLNVLKEFSPELLRMVGIK
jgi:hypothetical protein